MCLRDRVRRTDDFAVDVEALDELFLEAAEQMDVFCFLAREFQERAGAVVLAVDVGPRVVEHEGQDEFLDQTEDRQIGVAADLVQHAFFGGREEIHLFDAREAFGHERFREIERLAFADQVFDAPGDALGAAEHVLEIVVVGHGCFLRLVSQ